MSRQWMVAAFVAATLAAAPALARTPAIVAAAIADTGRPDADKKVDDERKPGEMVVFAGIRPGSRVLDLAPGGGYFTRIFAKVVGDTGWVYAFVPAELDPIIAKRSPGVDIKKQFAAYPNVSVLHGPINSLAAPESLDVVWTAQNYHDFHDPMYAPADLALVNKAVFNALKPGGVFIILDHAAANGSGLRDTNTLHRIDEAAVKKEVQAAGFGFVGESNVLRNPKDPRDKPVFDPAIRHHTDQFILKFIKPRH
ncbi:MAG: hypothetical protein WDN01_10540 [Rhizomicrobium sp.]